MQDNPVLPLARCRFGHQRGRQSPFRLFGGEEGAHRVASGGEMDGTTAASLVGRSQPAFYRWG
jgi:hypothetical protein